MTNPTIPLQGVPLRIFISVDERTGSSTLSFAPREVGTPIVREGDASGELAMTLARSIASSYPGCQIGGPHFHASRRPGSPSRRRR